VGQPTERRCCRSTGTIVANGGIRRGCIRRGGVPRSPAHGVIARLAVKCRRRRAKPGAGAAQPHPREHGIRDHRKVVHGVKSRRFAPASVVSVGTAAVLRRACACTADTLRIALSGHRSLAVLDANLVLPLTEHVVDVPEPGVPAKPQVRQRQIGRRAAQVRSGVARPAPSPACRSRRGEAASPVFASAFGSVW